MKKSKNILKTARFEMRMSEENKTDLQKAATLSGIDLTSFVLLAALKEASKVIQESHRRVMSENDQARFFDILMADEKPTKYLREAVKFYKASRNG